MLLYLQDKCGQSLGHWAVKTIFSSSENSQTHHSDQLF
jgi:hypothetical protein